MTFNNVISTAEAIEGVLSQRHQKLDYAIVTPLELLEQARTTRMMFMAFMGLIAAIFVDRGRHRNYEYYVGNCHGADA